MNFRTKTDSTKPAWLKGKRLLDLEEVEFVRDVETRGGTVYPKGTRFKVSHVYRGMLSLTKGPSHVELSDVQPISWRTTGKFESRFIASLCRNRREYPPPGWTAKRGVSAWGLTIAFTRDADPEPREEYEYAAMMRLLEIAGEGAG